MTAEQIHDALTLLPSDLIEAADKKRSRKNKPIVWKRYAAMAACFALVACSSWFCLQLFGPKGSSMKSLEESPAEAAAMQAEENGSGGTSLTMETQAAAYEEAAESKNTAGDIQADTSEKSTSTAAAFYSGISQPRYIEAVFASSSACFGSNPRPWLFQSRGDLESYQETSIRFQLENLMEDCKDYDDVWFESHDLLVVSLYGVPADVQNPVTGIQEQDGQWVICVENYYDSPAAERMNWHVLFETEKGLIPDRDSITIVYE